MNFGLSVPPTKVAASLLLDFLNKGNGTGGKEVSDRVAVAKTYFNRWHEKNVRFRKAFGKGQEGALAYIRYLRALRSSEVKGKRADRRVTDLPTVQRPHPFCAVVTLLEDDQKIGNVPLFYLELVEDTEKEQGKESS